MGHKRSADGKIQKRYYHLQLENGTESGFKRCCFNFIDSTSLKLVQYTGDHGLVVPYAHQNSKQLGAYSMSLPSTLLNLQKACESKDAHKVYREAINSTKSIN